MWKIIVQFAAIEIYFIQGLFGDDFTIWELNMALGRITTQSSTYKEQSSTYAIDGNQDDDFINSQHCTRTLETPHNTFQVDLGQLVHIAEVVIINQNIKPSWLSDITVMTTAEPICPGEIVQSDEICGNVTGLYPAGPVRVLCSNIMTSKRYVTLQQNWGLNILSLCEIIVIPAGLYNAALGKPAYSQSVFETYNASRANNGNLDPNLSLGHCYKSEPLAMNYWEVDLGTPMNFSLVIISTAEDSSLGGFLDFEVFGSDVLYTGDFPAVDNQSCAYNRWPLDVATHTWLTCTQQIFKRFVVLRQYTEEILRLVLCEVQIVAECFNGQFGRLCERNCAVNCDGDCNKASGVCPSCKAGLHGLYCDKDIVDHTEWR